ncbi:MAG TPA: cytochrome c [Longimicrobiales bacterium]
MELTTRSGVFLSLLTLSLLAAPAAAQSAPADSTRSAEGAYSAAQATQGENTFRTVCGNCHGTAEFSGQTFRKVWTGRPVYEFYDLIRNAMPLDNPGGLTPAEYAAVVAYILKLNGYPAGAAVLPVDDARLKAIRF